MSSPLIPSVDDDIAGLEVLGELLDGLVDRGTGLDEDDDAPGPLEGQDKVLDLLKAFETLAQAWKRIMFGLEVATVLGFSHGHAWEVVALSFCSPSFWALLTAASVLS